MEDKIPFHPDNKIYDFSVFKPKFITDLQNYFRKLKLKRYKNRKIKESKTPFQRNYCMKFKIHILDEYNPQVSDVEYEMLVPAQAVFFAKIQLDKAIKEKIAVEVVDFEELDEEAYNKYLQSKEEVINQKSQ